MSFIYRFSNESFTAIVYTTTLLHMLLFILAIIYLCYCKIKFICIYIYRSKKATSFLLAFSFLDLSKLPKTVFLSRSYANVYDDLDKEFKSTKPLLSRSTDLAKTLDRSQRTGTWASLADAVSLSAFDQVVRKTKQSYSTRSVFYAPKP